MTTLREAAQQALNKFDSMGHEDSIFAGEFDEIITALRTALQTPPPPPEAQTEAEKNAYHYGWWAAMEAVREQRTEPERLYDTDIYNFAGWLTCRPGRMEVGSSWEAASMAEAVDEYIKKYPERFAAPQRTEPEQEPVAWINVWGDLLRHHPAEYGRNDEHENWIPLYTHPAPQPVTLTDEEIAAISAECAASAYRWNDFEFARAVIEAYQRKQGSEA